MKTNNSAAAAEPAEADANHTESDPKVLALEAQVAELTKLAKANEDRAVKAEAERIKTEAEAKITQWTREGRLTGNAVEAVRKVFVAASSSQPVAAADVEAMILALPKFDTSRVAGDAAPPASATDAPNREDFKAFDRGDRAAKAKVDAHVKKLVAGDKSKNYVAHMKAVRAAAFA